MIRLSEYKEGRAKDLVSELKKLLIQYTRDTGSTVKLEMNTNVHETIITNPLEGHQGVHFSEYCTAELSINIIDSL